MSGINVKKASEAYKISKNPFKNMSIHRWSVLFFHTCLYYSWKNLVTVFHNYFLLACYKGNAVFSNHFKFKHIYVVYANRLAWYCLLFQCCRHDSGLVWDPSGISRGSCFSCQYQKLFKRIFITKRSGLNSWIIIKALLILWSFRRCNWRLRSFCINRICTNISSGR